MADGLSESSWGAAHGAIKNGQLPVKLAPTVCL